MLRLSFDLNSVLWIAGEVYSSDYRFTIVEMQYLGDLAKLVYFKSSLNVMENLFLCYCYVKLRLYLIQERKIAP